LSGSSHKAIYAALLGNSLIAITKFAAAAMTGSAAMMSEGIHSLVDTGNQCLLLLGLKRSNRPPSAEFPFGHGKEVYFWSFVVAILIFALGAGISLYQGWHHIQHPEPLVNVTVNYIVLGLAILFEAGAFYIAAREFSRQKGNLGYLEAVKRGKDPTLFVVLFEDGAAILGLLVALTGIAVADATGNPLFDGLASIAIGIILGGTAIWLAYETQGLLIGESASSWIAAEIRKILLANDAVKLVNEVATLHMGPAFILVTISVDFTDELDANELESEVAELTDHIKNVDPAVRRVFIEAERWRDHRREMADAGPTQTE
jgi:cation diffusion facilitator family transporter